MNPAQLLHEQVSLSFDHYGSFAGVLLALSGGADSVALLHALVHLQSHKKFRLHAMHINHGFREASKGEEKFVRKLCDELKVPLSVHHLPPLSKGNLENLARIARYQVLIQEMKEKQLNIIAVAHHGNDQAETLLMHLLRGAGLDGIAGMKAYRPPIWRPLLNVYRSDIEQYLTSMQQSWVEDESNQDNKFFRNAIRSQVMPLLEQIAPGAVLRLNQSANIFQEEQSAWQDMENVWLTSFASFVPPFVFLDKTALLKQPLGFQRRLIRSFMFYRQITLDFQQTNELLSFLAMNSSNYHNLPQKHRAFSSSKWLHILPDKVESLQVPWQQPLVLGFDGKLGDGIKHQAVDEDVCSGAVMRQAQPGDIVRPFGMSGSMPLRKYLGGKQVDLPFRHFWPVYALGNEVLWVPGLGVSQSAAVTKDTRSAIMLVFNDRLPGEIESEDR